MAAAFIYEGCIDCRKLRSGPVTNGAQVPLCAFEDGTATPAFASVAGLASNAAAFSPDAKGRTRVDGFDECRAKDPLKPGVRMRSGAT